MTDMKIAGRTVPKELKDGYQPEVDSKKKPPPAGTVKPDRELDKERRAAAEKAGSAQLKDSKTGKGGDS